MSAHLSLLQLALLSGYALGMAAGQLLFKAASARLAENAPFTERALALFASPAFIAALALYFALSVLWVWVLSFTPLSRAYPFVALAFVLTPLLAAFTFSEPLTLRLLLGIGLILAGLLLVAR